MEQAERDDLIDRLDRSFHAMPRWAQIACKHGMGAPKNNPETGEPFKSFREVISVASDDSLETLKGDFEDNGDLLPSTRQLN